MNAAELQKHIAWLQYEDIRSFLACDDVPSPWFPAYRCIRSADQKLTWFCALVPPTLIPNHVKNSGGWDIHIGDGGPSVGTSWSGGVEKHTYTPFGNEGGIDRSPSTWTVSATAKARWQNLDSMSHERITRVRGTDTFMPWSRRTWV